MKIKVKVKVKVKFFLVVKSKFLTINWKISANYYFLFICTSMFIQLYAEKKDN